MGLEEAAEDILSFDLPLYAHLAAAVHAVLYWCYYSGAGEGFYRRAVEAAAASILEGRVRTCAGDIEVPPGISRGALASLVRGGWAAASEGNTLSFHHRALRRPVARAEYIMSSMAPEDRDPARALRLLSAFFEAAAELESRRPRAVDRGELEALVRALGAPLALLRRGS